MSDTKASAESSASAIADADLWGGVQSGGDVKFTALQFKTYIYKGGTFSATYNDAPLVTVASATTTDIGAAASNNVTISGTTTITGLGTIADGAVRRVTFSGILTLTHNSSSLILPGGASITTAAGDAGTFVSLGSGNWRCLNYSRASALPLVTVPIASGGTASTSASAARTALGLAIGTDVQAHDSDLDTIAALTATTDSFMQSKSSAWAARTIAQVIADLQSDGLSTPVVGFRAIPQNSKSADYTCVAADSGKHIFHPASDTTARTFTIDSNANVAHPIGTAITFVNQHAGGVITIAITSDTMRLAGAGSTGSRTLAADGVATALKIASTEWIVSGTGLT